MALPDPVGIADPPDRILHTADLRPAHEELLPDIDRAGQDFFPRHRVRRLCACFLVCLHLFFTFSIKMFSWKSCFHFLTFIIRGGDFFYKYLVKNLVFVR